MTSMLARPLAPFDAGTALFEVSAFADGIIQTLRIARALLLGGRKVCLEGLDAQVAQLCARCLGLDQQDASRLRLHLLALRAELDTTTSLLEASYAGERCRSTMS